MDSRLFYRHGHRHSRLQLDEQAAVPHHPIDLCAPDETMSLSAFRLAYQTIDDILRLITCPSLLAEQDNT
ncbi:MAG: hypothetical protein R3C44_04370 [Chloroflexota bacterium]